MSEKHLKKKKKYFEYYIVERSEEFARQYDHETSWIKLMQRVRKRRMKRITFYAASISAALFLLVIGSSYLFSLYTDFQGDNKVLISPRISFPEKGGRKAFLTLDDGTRIDLTTQGGVIDSTNMSVAISNDINQVLTYQKSNSIRHLPQKNTLFVPRGGEYQLILSDGSKIWMNAESTLQYPTVFTEKTREVYLDGEAFFEVAKDINHPFIVRAGRNTIEVLGTLFNISAYPDSKTYTTLVRGKVKVSTEYSAVVLHPDQQAVISIDNKNLVAQNVSTHLFTSWVKGNYEFRNTTLADVAAQLSRWYNIDILFRNNSLKNKRFAGIIFRNEQLSFAIEIIERVLNVHFIREGDVIYIEDAQ